MIWTNVNQDDWRHMASPGHNELFPTSLGHRSSSSRPYIDHRRTDDQCREWQQGAEVGNWTGLIIYNSRSFPIASFSITPLEVLSRTTHSSPQVPSAPGHQHDDRERVLSDPPAVWVRRYEVRADEDTGVVDPNSGRPGADVPGHIIHWTAQNRYWVTQRTFDVIITSLLRQNAGSKLHCNVVLTL